MVSNQKPFSWTGVQARLLIVVALIAATIVAPFTANPAGASGAEPGPTEVSICDLTPDECEPPVGASADAGLTPALSPFPPLPVPPIPVPGPLPVPPVPDPFPPLPVPPVPPIPVPPIPVPPIPDPFPPLPVPIPVPPIPVPPIPVPPIPDPFPPVPVPDPGPVDPGPSDDPEVAGPSGTALNCPVGDHPFTDIAGSFAEASITCLYLLDITSGATATTYNPAGQVTREQMAAYLARTWRAFGNTCASSGHPFTDVAGSFAEADIACIEDVGITGGVTPTTYDPAGVVSREQMGAFIARLLRELGGTCGTTNHPFVDIGGSFAEADIACLVAAGITSGIGPDLYGPNQIVNREQMAAFIARLIVSFST